MPKAKTKKNTVLINFILDETGSMHSMKDEVIRGFNKYVDELRADKASNYLFTLVKFDSLHHEVVCTAAPLADAPTLSDANYKPGAATPLYDAVAKTINETDATKATKVLTVIFTDGQENASHEWKLDGINKLLKEKEAEGWTFMYLGVAPEAWSNQAMFAGTVSAANAYSTSGAQAMNAALRSASFSTMAYAASAPTASARTIVSEEEKKKAQRLNTR